MLDGMLDSFDQGLSRAAQSRAEQGEQSRTLLGEMLDSSDQGLIFHLGFKFLRSHLAFSIVLYSNFLVIFFHIAFKITCFIIDTIYHRQKFDYIPLIFRRQGYNFCRLCKF